MVRIQQQYGWAPEEPGADQLVDLHGPFASRAEAAADVIRYYTLAPDQEVDVYVGVVRPVRVWEWAPLALEEVLVAMRRRATADGANGTTGPGRMWLDRTATLVLQTQQQQAEYNLRWHHSKWAERYLRSDGWWLVNPQLTTVAGGEHGRSDERSTPQG